MIINQAGAPATITVPFTQDATVVPVQLTFIVTDEAGNVLVPETWVIGTPPATTDTTSAAGTTDTTGSTDTSGTTDSSGTTTDTTGSSSGDTTDTSSTTGTTDPSTDATP